MSEQLASYVLRHTVRGECKCGRCIDVGNAPEPEGHTADMVFFKVAANEQPTADEFLALTRESHHGDFVFCDPLDGKEHGYMELGGWIGDQQVALRYMGLGHILGIFDLLTPRNVLRLNDTDIEMKLAEAGYLTVKAKAARAA